MSAVEGALPESLHDNNPATPTAEQEAAVYRKHNSVAAQPLHSGFSTPFKSEQTFEEPATVHATSTFTSQHLCEGVTEGTEDGMSVTAIGGAVRIGA